MASSHAHGTGVARESALNAEAVTSMSVPQFLHRLLAGQSESTTVYECRYCRTTIDSQTDSCPYCGPTEVVEYELA
jgi:rubrerythrin